MDDLELPESDLTTAQALTLIGAELQQIRLELQQANQFRRAQAQQDATESEDTYDCKHGTYASDAKARRHAINEHNAPETGDSWQAVFA